MAVSKATRGNTQANRLRIADQWYLALHRKTSHPPLFVDVGFGKVADTSVRFHERLCGSEEGWELLAVDMDPARVAAAQASFAQANRRFIVQGFDLPVLRPTSTDDAPKDGKFSPKADLIRALNVLRQYSSEQCADVHQELGAALVEHGLLLEGTSDPSGDLLSFHAFSRRGAELVREALVFGVSGRCDFGPWQLRDVLPQDLRRRALPGTWLWRFFSAWNAAAKGLRKKDPTHPMTSLEVCRTSANCLAEQGWPVQIESLEDGVTVAICPTKDPHADALLTADCGPTTGVDIYEKLGGKKPSPSSEV